MSKYKCFYRSFSCFTEAEYDSLFNRIFNSHFHQKDDNIVAMYRITKGLNGWHTFKEACILVVRFYTTTTQSDLLAFDLTYGSSSDRNYINEGYPFKRVA